MERDADSGMGRGWSIGIEADVANRAWLPKAAKRLSKVNGKGVYGGIIPSIPEVPTKVSRGLLRPLLGG